MSDKTSEANGPAPPPEEVALVADIGGTHVRFGLVDRTGAVLHEATLFCSEYSEPAAAAAVFLAENLPGFRPRRGVFAVASPITGDRVEMTNHPWGFSIDETRRALDLVELQVVNDFTALALSLPCLGPADLRRIKSGSRRPNAAMALLGPGTGLGVSGLLSIDGAWWPLSTEGGHRDLAATSEREWQVHCVLQRRYGRVSAERVLSGPGLVNIYEALGESEEAVTERLSPAEVAARAQEDPAGLEGEAVRLFSGWLGAVAGDLALTVGATGGVFLAGGILPKMGSVFDEVGFTRRFVAKGRLQAYLEEIPVDLILHPTAALIGAARIAARNSTLRD